MGCFRVIVGLSVLFSVEVFASASANLCPNPKLGSPGLSFSMTAGAPGDLARNCKNQLNRARYLGFTGVTLTPTFHYDSKGVIQSTQKQSDIDECLNLAMKMGFEISYKPHIEAHVDASIKNPETDKRIFGSGETLADVLVRGALAHESTQWRATLSMNPLDQYEKKVIAPFMQWMDKNKQNISRKNSPPVQLTVATELHHSVALYPKQWNTLIWNTQKKLEKAGIRKQVEVGLDPSIFKDERYSYPSTQKSTGTKQSPLLKADRCEDYKKLLWSADFYSPSIYGNLEENGFHSDPKNSHTKLNRLRANEFLDTLKKLGCPLDKRLTNRFLNADYDGRDKGRSSKRTQYGEMGFGGNLTASYSQFLIHPPKQTPFQPLSEYHNQLEHFKKTTLVADQAVFKKYAVKWVKGALDSLKGSYIQNANIWTTGRFDLFGFSKFPALGDLSSVAGQYNGLDPVKGPDQIKEVAQIRDALQSYTRERCPGWKPIVPVPPKPKRRKVKSCHQKAIPPPQYEDLLEFQQELNAIQPEIDFGDLDFD